MGKRRLESFSDGVLAIIITIMVLDLKKPSGDKLDDLLTLWPTILSYFVSFLIISVFWLIIICFSRRQKRLTQRFYGAICCGSL